ncbi:MAG: hypothetical protein OZ921_15000 [Sorangiineae bacterium]|nr:hypothetical protein [Polyangiaceae bacterium]MEB2323818.1 hypothetical protein [Sorangiineae bacterium]
MSRISRRWWCLGAALALVGCLSPTLPLPPPSPTVSGPDASGMVEISGYVDPGATVYAVNLRNDELRGQISDARTGEYDFFLPAEVGDRVDVYVQLGNDRSPPYSTVIRP